MVHIVSLSAGCCAADMRDMEPVPNSGSFHCIAPPAQRGAGIGQEQTIVPQSTEISTVTPATAAPIIIQLHSVVPAGHSINGSPASELRTNITANTSSGSGGGKQPETYYYSLGAGPDDIRAWAEQSQQLLVSALNLGKHSMRFREQLRNRTGDATIGHGNSISTSNTSHGRGLGPGRQWFQDLMRNVQHVRLPYNTPVDLVFNFLDDLGRRVTGGLRCMPRTLIKGLIRVNSCP